MIHNSLHQFHNLPTMHKKIQGKAIDIALKESSDVIN